jgi:hypothetical protein
MVVVQKRDLARRRLTPKQLRAQSSSFGLEQKQQDQLQQDQQQTEQQAGILCVDNSNDAEKEERIENLGNNKDNHGKDKTELPKPLAGAAETATQTTETRRRSEKRKRVAQPRATDTSLSSLTPKQSSSSEATVRKTNVTATPRNAMYALLGGDDSSSSSIDEAAMWQEKKWDDLSSPLSSAASKSPHQRRVGRLATTTTQQQDDLLWQDGDDDSVTSAGGWKRPTRLEWTDEESNAVREGYLRHGQKWRLIKDNCDNRLCRRTNVQINDKFRTMLKRGEIKKDL